MQLPDSDRILFEATLTPAQGHRFQPTGFPDIGAATYQAPDGTEMLLVESAQSMANRLEAVCFDGELAPPLRGLPYVTVQTPRGATSTLEEAHRLNSVYLVNTDFFADLAQQLGYKPKGKTNYEPVAGRPTTSQLANVIARIDPNSIVHGVFLEKIAGVLRLPRILSSFVEASGVGVVASGGVKNDRLDASGKSDGASGAKDGYGNVPYHRTEYTAREIVAYFNVDLRLLRSYRLPAALERLIYVLSLWKVRTLLDGDLRLRTACDLIAADLAVKRPTGWALPPGPELDHAIRTAIDEAREHLGDVVVAKSSK